MVGDSKVIFAVFVADKIGRNSHKNLYSVPVKCISTLLEVKKQKPVEINLIISKGLYM
jgi:hypothetical protein